MPNLMMFFNLRKECEKISNYLVSRGRNGSWSIKDQCEAFDVALGAVPGGARP
jgi:hypothetical protein